MVDRLQLDCDEYDDEDEIVAQNSHRVIAKTDEIMRSCLTKKWFRDFVTKNTLIFFNDFPYQSIFLGTAERAMQLMAGFVGIITKDEKRYRVVVTVVDD